MSAEHWNLLLYALGTLIVVAGLSWSIGSFAYQHKMKAHREIEGYMTKKECLEQQNDCPQIAKFDAKLEKILHLIGEACSHIGDVKESFTLFLSQTSIDDGIKKYIQEKLERQIGGRT